MFNLNVIDWLWLAVAGDRRCRISHITCRVSWCNSRACAVCVYMVMLLGRRYISEWIVILKSLNNVAGLIYGGLFLTLFLILPHTLPRFYPLPPPPLSICVALRMLIDRIPHKHTHTVLVMLSILLILFVTLYLVNIQFCVHACHLPHSSNIPGHIEPNIHKRTKLYISYTDLAF